MKYVSLLTTCLQSYSATDVVISIYTYQIINMIPIRKLIPYNSQFIFYVIGLHEMQERVNIDMWYNCYLISKLIFKLAE